MKVSSFRKVGKMESVLHSPMVKGTIYRHDSNLGVSLLSLVDSKLISVVGRKLCVNL